MPVFSKPWSAAQFISARPYLVIWLNENVVPHLNEDEIRKILIHAPVKSGKREMAEYLAMLDHCSNPHVIHMFISAWHRSADEDQRIELGQHYIHVFSIISKNERARCLEFISQQIHQRKRIVIHYDECDHGSGARQMMSQIWRTIRDDINIKTIMYSATHEEVLFSAEVDDDPDYENMLLDYHTTGIVVNYTPPEGFCGPKRFLNEGLVFNATPFIEKTREGALVLSSQAREIVDGLRQCMARPETRKRNIIVLRLSSSEKNTKRGTQKIDKKLFYLFLQNIHLFPELHDFNIWVDKSDISSQDIRANPRININTIGWSKPQYWRGLSTEYPTLIVIDQTSTRSTEWACHDRVYAHHDFRNTITYSVVSQAQERLNHYTSKYEGGFQPVRIYGHKRTFELSAGLITYHEYITLDYASKKMRVDGHEDSYRIIHKNNRTVHPDYPEEYTEHRANEILAIIGCLEVPSISSRLKGTIRQETVTESRFIACGPDTFETIARPQIEAACIGQAFHNPFTRAAEHMEGDRYKGYLRGWFILNYENDVKPSRWGFSIRDLDGPVEQRPGRITVCYKDGMLGIALRKPIGAETISNLTTWQSQYQAKEPARLQHA